MIDWARLSGVALLFCAVSACSQPLCGDASVGSSSDTLQLVTDGEPVKRIGGEFFGFNLETVEFQLSLWDAGARQVRPEVLSALRPFQGAVYRLPGGSTANYYRWKDGIGDVRERRKSVRITEWTDLPRIDFGMAEYMRFLETVDGTGWFIVNLHGDWDDAVNMETLAGEAAELAAYVRKRAAGGGRGFLRWELGNELDRGREMWTSRKYLHHATMALDAIRAADPQARFVGMMQDYDAQKSLGVKSTDYNRAVASRLGPLGLTDFQQHIYYDGPPEGPYLPNRLKQLCQSVDDARQSGIDRESLAFWVTEHARWPQKDRKDEPWKASWRKSADLGAAISVADMMIALTQVPAVRGGFLHALHGTEGPWPLFHPGQGASTGTYHPAATLYAYRLLRQSLLPVVLKSQSLSPNTSGYGGGYDARAAVLTSEDRSRFTIWAVNRSSNTVTASVRIPELAGKTLHATMTTLSGKGPQESNYDRPDTVAPRSAPLQIAFDAKGNATFALSGLSVSAVYFPVRE